MLSLSGQKSLGDSTPPLVRAGKPQSKRGPGRPRLQRRVSEREPELLVPQSRFFPLHRAVISFRPASNSSKTSLKSSPSPNRTSHGEKQATIRVRSAFTPRSSTTSAGSRLPSRSALRLPGPILVGFTTKIAGRLETKPTE